MKDKHFVSFEELKRQHNFDLSQHLPPQSGLNSSRSLFSFSRPGMQLLRPQDFTSAVDQLRDTAQDVPTVVDEVVAFIPSSTLPDPSIQQLLEHNMKQAKRYGDFIENKMKDRFQSFVVKFKQNEKIVESTSNLIKSPGAKADGIVYKIKLGKNKDADQFNSRDDPASTGANRFLRTKSFQPKQPAKPVTITTIPEKAEDVAPPPMYSRMQTESISRNNLKTESGQHDEAESSSEGENPQTGQQ